MSTNTSHYSRVRVGYPSPFTDAARSIKRQRPNHSCYFPLRHRQRPTDPPPPPSPSVSFSDSSSPPLLRSPATVVRAPLSLSVKPCHSEFLLQTDWRADATPLCVRPCPLPVRLPGAGAPRCSPPFPRARRGRPPHRRHRRSPWSGTRSALPHQVRMRGGEARKEEERVIVIACLTLELIMNRSIRHALGTRPRALNPEPLAE